MGEGFELLDHPSEVGFRARGKTLEQAFENAGRALFQVMTDIDDLRTDVTVDIEVDAESLAALLFDFVDELIFIAEADGVLLKEFDLELATYPERFKVKGTATGQAIEDGLRLQDVKAPTYSDMRVEQNAEEKWVLEMTLDV